MTWMCHVRNTNTQDMENTTGSWQMYGNDSKERYPQLQAEFFNRAAESLSRRVALRGIIAASGLAALTQWGYAGAKAVKLPITVGPLTGGENGKGGSVSSKL